MLEINFELKNITYMDSLAKNNLECKEFILLYLFCKKYNHNITWNEKQYENALRNWDKLDDFNNFKKEWKWELKFSKALQSNSYDCGVFAYLFALFSSSKQKITFTQKDIDEIRMRMELQVINCDL